jgi:hypothetical protein
MKKLKLIRDTFTDNCTLGKLYIDGKYFCETLEDKDRGLNQSLSLEENKRLKFKGQTAIPYGIYKGVVNVSPSKKRALPRLLNVPAYEGVLIHKGNTNVDSLGCILVGRKRSIESVIQSTVMEVELLKIMPLGTEFEIEITKSK